MRGQWRDVQGDHLAYQDRWRTESAEPESAELPEVREALATGLQLGLRWMGLQAAFGHPPGAAAPEAPFAVVKSGTSGGAIEPITLGSNDTDPAGPGGLVALYYPLEVLIAIGPSAGDYVQLQLTAEAWYLPVVRWLVKNQTAGQTCRQLSLAASRPEYDYDLVWGAQSWFALRVPLVAECWYLLPAG